MEALEVTGSWERRYIRQSCWQFYLKQRFWQSKPHLIQRFLRKLISLWTKPAWLGIPGSFFFWLVFFVIYAPLAPYVGISGEYRGLLPVLYGSKLFWFTIIILPMLCILRDYGWKFYQRMYISKPYHYIQEIQKFNIPDYRPRMERFRKAVHKARMIQRLKRSRGFAFSQSEGGQEKLIRAYDTTLEKPRG